MSKVYEALKRAQREGRWRDSGDDPQSRASSEQRVSELKGREYGSNGGDIPPKFNGEDEAREQESSEPGRHEFVDSCLGLSSGSVHPRRATGRAAGTVPRNTGVGGPSLIMHQKSLSRAGEQFQVLRASLESWAVEHDGRTILMTSALPGEGKSFVALNLAVALSDAGFNVLLVDADLRAPSLHRSFNLVPVNGLLPYLEGKEEFAESISATSSPRLGLLAAAGVTLSGPEAFASSRMRDLIRSARELKPPHFVLIDAPAALVGPEVQILSKLVDTALVVVAANDTPRTAVTKTLEMIKSAPLFGVVLNRFQPSYSASRNLRYRAAKYGSDNDA
jgi:protein-tyrosine kinase